MQYANCLGHSVFALHDGYDLSCCMRRLPVKMLCSCLLGKIANNSPCHVFCLQSCKLDGILVLRIQDGNDIFVSVTGRYQPSFYGVSFQCLGSLPR